MATYKEIVAFVRDESGFTPQTCWIADVKERCGLKPRPAPNRYSVERAKPCPASKRPAIESALKHFGMI